MAWGTAVGEEGKQASFGWGAGGMVKEKCTRGLWWGICDHVERGPLVKAEWKLL